jgi:hypothetical protein
VGSGAWGFRPSRFDIPFGEEYLYRDAIDNPLVSHSVSDMWGIDEGAELYGSRGHIDYVLAVQNGGHPSLKDGDQDKAVVARVGVEPRTGLRFSLSGMRTGDIDPVDDEDPSANN